ncbi:hypothetical protein [Mesorhizobium sp. B2-4-7]|uniref:hypothetical protein n=1 Tax=Mesorhizobium sp. B2-4-7 TaxID=2589942 RepID=UPI00112E6C86|nr:hypothetical protein [Mesorhizobium sp. B2-4-7]TPL30218.1 hypothetical protein FJ946_02835 [Mesorhizobium sp. B2-4-7]
MLDLSSFRSTRRWWPSALFDEQMPPGRAQPQDWLKPDLSGITIIRDEDDPEAGILATMLPGEIAEFVWHERRGSVEILLMLDGTWSLADPRDDRTIDMFRPEPETPAEPTELPPSARIAAANWFAWEEDYETMADTMDGFAQAFAYMDPPDAEGSRITVDMGYWCDGVKFRVSADGKSLEPIDG